MSENSKNRVCIVVLGDIGRSPRMQYHALSLIKEGYIVEFIGYGGSQPIIELLESDQVYFHYLPEVPNFKVYFPSILSFFLKVLFQFFTLFYYLNFKLNKLPNYLLIQNPPSIPSILLCSIYCLFYNIQCIIDWHNYAYTILSLNLKSSTHILVQISKIYEKYCSKLIKKNLCVTKSMKYNLKENWNVEATTLYDRAPERFHPTSSKDRTNLFEKLSIEYPELKKLINVNKNTPNPGLLISSTSWTEDEDFSILFRALSLYDADPEAEIPLIVIVTGKGPMKEFYLNEIRTKIWKKISIYTPWLTAEDYPKLIGCADLGVSLHTSSSGLDLPMKVVDMFGCEVAVCAKNFKCLNELVQHEMNGFVFDTEEELSQQIKIWFQNSKLREKIKNQVGHFRRQKWHENWKINALPMFK